MKKMSLLAAAALVSTFLVACEGKKEKPAEETKAPETTEQVQKPEETKEVPEKMEQKAEETVKEEAPKVEEKETLQEKVESEVKETEKKAEEIVEKAKEEVSEKMPAIEEQEAPQMIENKPAQKIDGRKLFSSKGCTVCHKENLDTVGPALSKIAKKYNGDKDSLIQFLRGKHPAIVDPARYTMMKPQISITKQMSEDELNALADYILNVK